MKKCRFFTWVLALLLVLSACACGSGTPTTDTGTDTPDETQTGEVSDTLSIISSGKSSFAILYDPVDIQAGALAKALQNTLMKQCGTVLPLRTVRDADSYPERILVGDTGLAESDALKATTPADSCSVKVTDRSLVLFADDFDGYLLLEAYVTGSLLVSARKEEWKLPVGSSWTGTSDPETDRVEFDRDGGAVYNLVFSSADTDQLFIATAFAKYLSNTTGVKFKAVADSGTYQNEILLGPVDRPQTGLVSRYLPTGCYLSGVCDGKYVIASDDRFGLAVGVLRLAERLCQPSGGALTVTCEERFTEAISGLPQDGFLENAVLLARETYGTYGSWISKQMASMSQSDRNDIALVNALISRIDGGLVLSVGSSSALAGGYVVKLDRSDYSRCTVRTADGKVLVPPDFVAEFFGTVLPVSSDGSADLTAFCNATDAWSLFYDAETGIITVMPEGTAPFDDPTQTVGDYTNRQYFSRMQRFFSNPYLPEPEVPVEQTRQEIVSVSHDDTYVWDYTQTVYQCYASPAILTLTGADGKKVLYTAYDISQMHFPKGVNTMICCDTVFQKSTDGGETWEQIAFEKGWTYVSLTELDGKILLMGTRTGDGYVTVGLYDPASGSYRSSDLGFSVMGTAPTAVAVYNGRLWRAHNNAVISAPLGSDLLDGNNWTKSESPNDILDEAYYEKKTGLNVTGRFWLEEGNMVVGRDGRLYAIYRIDASPSYGYAAIFTVSENGKTLAMADCAGCFAPGLIAFPSNQSKFMIRYDDRTDRYLSLVSVTTGTSQNQRNVLALVSSKDLFTWETVGTLLVERQMMNDRLSEISHAFQYVDFVFDGEDLLFIVREATGKSCNYHNANAITLYRLAGYADYINRHTNG